MTSHRFLLLPVVVLLLAPLWVHSVPIVGGQSLFVTADSLIVLGAALLAGLLFEFFLPEAYCPNFKKFGFWIQSYFPAISICFLVLLFIGLVLTNRYILRHFMNSADEHSCYFLAECIKQGKFWATPPPLSDFFEMVHVGNKNGKWFSVYPPGWPLLMAVALKLNALNFLNPVLTIVAVILFYHVGKKLFGSMPTTLGIFLMSITPFFIFNNASYFSHTTCLVTIGLFLWSYLKWNETHHSGWWAVLSALSIGYGLGTRYLTMAAISAPFIFYQFTQLVKRRQRWDKSYMVFGVVLFIMCSLNLFYNYAITGNPFNAPNHFHHGLERLGFNKEYTFITALIFILARMFYLIDWMAAPFLLFYVISLFNQTSEGPNQRLFRFGFLYLIIGYIFYYSWGGNQYGPRYYFEGLPFLFIALSDRLIAWWKNGSIQTRKFILGVMLVSIIGNLYLFEKQAVFFQRVSSERKALYELAEKTIQRPSIVLIRGFLGDALVMSQEDVVRNRPQLDDKILYAHDLGEKNKILKQYFFNRGFYLGSYDRQRRLPKLEIYRG